MDPLVMPGVTPRMSVCVVNAAANLGLCYWRCADLLIVFDLLLSFVFGSFFVSFILGFGMFFFFLEFL